jgi:hypothetical protein
VVVPSGGAALSAVVPSGGAALAAVVPIGGAALAAVVPIGGAALAVVVPIGGAALAVVVPIGGAALAVVVPIGGAALAVGVSSSEAFAPLKKFRYRLGFCVEVVTLGLKLFWVFLIEIRFCSESPLRFYCVLIKSMRSGPESMTSVSKEYKCVMRV